MTHEIQWSRFTGFGIVLVMAFVIFVIGYFNQPEKAKQADDPRHFNQVKYEGLMKRLSPTSVCPGIKPVHIFREVDGKKYLHATGGQMIKDGSILTCGHAFWNTPNEPKVPWKFYYQILQPYKEGFYPIGSLRKIDVIETNTIQASRDVITCQPGEVRSIEPFQDPGEVVSGKTTTFDSYREYSEKISVKSTVTGESFNILGEAKIIGGPWFYVLDYASFQGESGTVFVADNNKTLYILSQSVLTNPELQEAFKLDKSKSGLTLCSSVSIN